MLKHTSVPGMMPGMGRIPQVLTDHFSGVRTQIRMMNSLMPRRKLYLGSFVKKVYPEISKEEIAGLFLTFASKSPTIKWHNVIAAAAKGQSEKCSL